MTRRNPITLLATAAAVPIVAFAAVGCGGGGNGQATASVTPPKTASGAAATVGAENAGNLGTILVDSKGDTLYLFKKDSGTKSACTGACASAWPPLRASGKPVAGTGATASQLGTAPRSDGKPQVTYNGHPLYTYSGDNNPGDTNGQGVSAFGAAWFALTPSGNQASGTSGTSSSGGGGGGY